MSVGEFLSLRMVFSPVTERGVITHFLGHAEGTLKLNLSREDLPPPGDPLRIAVYSTALPYDDDKPSGEWNSLTLPARLLELRNLEPGVVMVPFQTGPAEFSPRRIKEDKSGKSSPETQEWGVRASAFIFSIPIAKGRTQASEINREIII